VWAAEGSWLDPGFETCTTRAKWALVMRERDMARPRAAGRRAALPPHRRHGRRV